MKDSQHIAYLRNVWYTNDRTKHFEFETLNGSEFEYQPGQFISMDVRIDGEVCARPYSVASSPHQRWGSPRFPRMTPLSLGSHKELLWEPPGAILRVIFRDKWR